jgi:dolichol-phosphate mannosyltransferase
MYHAKRAEFDFGAAVAVVPPPGPLELAVVIPTFNEADNVRPLLARLKVALAGVRWEAIFVDDNSTDGTADLVRSIGIEDSSVRVVQRIGRRGLSSAVVEGMLATSAPVLAVIDADMQHDETILPDLHRAVAAEGYDLAIGSRYADGGSLGGWCAQRQQISRAATRLAHQVLRTEISDPMSGFFAVSRPALVRALPRLSSIGFKILVDIVASSPSVPRIKEVPYGFRERTAGESKLGSLVVWEYLTLLLDKLVGHLVPVRFLLFALTGGLGLGVHLAVLGALLALGTPFAWAQGLAVTAAMTFNYAVNNMLTYRDRQRRGWRFVTGLLSFYAVCLVGAVANVGIGTYVYEAAFTWWLAGAAGAVVGAVWNYAASSIFTWRK